MAPASHLFARPTSYAPFSRTYDFASLSLMPHRRRRSFTEVYSTSSVFFLEIAVHPFLPSLHRASMKEGCHSASLASPHLSSFLVRYNCVLSFSTHARPCFSPAYVYGLVPLFLKLVRTFLSTNDKNSIVWALLFSASPVITSFVFLGRKRNFASPFRTHLRLSPLFFLL